MYRSPRVLSVKSLFDLSRLAIAAFSALTVLCGSAIGQTGGVPPPPSRALETQEIDKLNAWTVGLAAGQLEGAPIRFATEIARVTDDGDNMNVLPIVTRG